VKNRDRNVNTEAETTGSASEAVTAVTEVAAAAPVSTEPNFTLRFKRNHPQDRASYGIAGVPGIVVVQRGMVFGTTPFASNTDLAGMPAEIVVSIRLADPKASNTEAKAAAAAAKAQEKADKAAAKLAAQQEKVAKKAKEAEEKLAAAKAKLEAATAAASAPAAEKVEGVEQL
jgi:hypothetical protein